jgi:hypothetical protein
MTARFWAPRLLFVARVHNAQARDLAAALANRLGRRSNTTADDFVDRFAGRAEIEKVIHYRSASLRQINVSGGLAHKSRSNCLPHHPQHFAVEAVGLCQKIFLIVVVNDAAIPDDAHPMFLNLHPLAQQHVPPLRHLRSFHMKMSGNLTMPRASVDLTIALIVVFALGFGAGYAVREARSPVCAVAVTYRNWPVSSQNNSDSFAIFAAIRCYNCIVFTTPGNERGVITIETPSGGNVIKGSPVA